MTMLTRHYEPNNNLISLTDLAKSLGIVKKQRAFSEDDYVPTTYHKCKDLNVCQDYQRLINEGFIRAAGFFDPTMISPMIVYRRPDGSMVIVDGQHSGCIAVIYTQSAGNTKFPCMVFDHPKDFTLKQCIEAESNHFKNRQKNRTNLGAVEVLRAGIAAGQTDALQTEDMLYSLGVCIENIGDVDGISVHGYAKLLEAYKTCGFSACKEAIELYDHLRISPSYEKWSIRGDMKGALIFGLAKVIWFRNEYCGAGEKTQALDTYLTKYLGKKNPDDLQNKTAGPIQGVLIARRIIDACNNLIESGVIVKTNGDEFKITIGEELLEKAGMGDPSIIK
jgi:hypothetical protein